METAIFSGLLLDLYRASATTPVKSFRAVALEAVRKHLPFDGVIWATTSLSGRRPTRHFWMMDDAPSELASLLENCPDNDEMICSLVRATPGQTLVFRPEDIPEESLSALITALSGMRHVMATADSNEALGTFNILTLGRRDGSRPFLPEERMLKQMLMPHLEAMVVRNFEAQILARMVGHAPGTVGTAVISDNVAVAAEPNFIQLMRHVWPAWSGPCLPDPLAKAALSSRSVLIQGQVTFHFVRRKDQLLLIASRQSAIDLLTQKEYTVAFEFAGGKSYKEVARLHGISPETVRSRLRMVYDKLGVGDKGELSRHFEQNKMLENLHDLL